LEDFEPVKHQGPNQQHTLVTKHCASRVKE
jgi:hypothetical protein